MTIAQCNKSIPPPLLLISSLQGPTNPPPSSLPPSPPPAVGAAPLSAAVTPWAGTSGHTSVCLARCRCRYRYRMAPTGALRNLTLALEAAVVVLGSLLFIAWKLYFRGSEPAGTWDDWWERELRELQERDPAGSAVRAAGAAAVGLSFAGIPTGMGKKLGSGWGLLPRGAEAVGSEVPPSPPRPEPTQLQKGVWDGSIDGTPPSPSCGARGLGVRNPPQFGKGRVGSGGRRDPSLQSGPRAAPLCPAARRRCGSRCWCWGWTAQGRAASCTTSAARRPGHASHPRWASILPSCTSRGWRWTCWRVRPLFPPWGRSRPAFRHAGTDAAHLPQWAAATTCGRIGRCT